MSRRTRTLTIVVPILLGVAVYFAAFGGDYSVFDLRRARSEVRERTVELARHKAQNDSLRARVDSLANDDGTLEKLAREQYGLIRDNEVLYIPFEADDTLSAKADSAR